jgi:AraC family transcriptional regulator
MSYQESVFDSLQKSNASLLSKTQLNKDLQLAYWSNTLDRVSYSAEKVHTLSFYLEGGQGSRRIDATAPQRSGNPGSICLFPQHQESTWEISAPFTFAHLYFSDQAIKQFASHSLDIEPRLIQIPELTFQQDAQLEALSAKLFNIASNYQCDQASPLAYEEAVQGLFHHLCVHYSGLTQTPLTGGLSPKALNRIKDYLTTHFNDDQSLTSLSQLAELVNLSEYHFLRMFKLSTGFTPNDYITFLKITEARKAIEKGLPLASVASHCGFANQSHLNRQFKKLTGVTPGQYRKHHL